MPDLESLGLVSTRSGGLLVIDTGYLGIWSHDRVPILPEGTLSTREATHHANSCVDLHIVGSDAELAGRRLGMSRHPIFIFDQPPDHRDVDEKLERIARDHKLDARFEIISPRVSHRKR